MCTANTNTPEFVLKEEPVNGPLVRYVKLWVVHALGMPGTFSPPPRFCDPDMHHGTCVTHVPWCMSGSLTSVSFEVVGGKNVAGIPGACATRNFTYLVRGPCACSFTYPQLDNNIDILLFTLKKGCCEICYLLWMVLMVRAFHLSLLLISSMYISLTKNQFWFITDVLRHSPEMDFTSAHKLNP